LRGLAVGVAVAASVAGFAYLIIGAVTGTLKHDDFGVVPIPGQATIELDAGTVAVFYQERTHLSEAESLDVPEFRLDVRGRGNAPVELEDAGPGSSYELNDLAGTQIGQLEIEEAGDYAVRTGGQVGRDRPEVSFGEDVPLGRLLGVSALIIVGGMVLGGLLWAIGSARRKRTPLRPGAAAPGARFSATAPPAVPEPPTAPPPRVADDPAARLRELDARRAAGGLSEAEYAAAREAVLREL